MLYRINIGRVDRFLILGGSFSYLDLSGREHQVFKSVNRSTIVRTRNKSKASK